MSDQSLKVFVVSGSSGRESTTAVVLEDLNARLEKLGCDVDFLNLATDPVPMFDIDTVYQSEDYQRLSSRAHQADVMVFGTPDYHGTISSGMKNVLDHLWKELAGKLMSTVVGSHEKGLTVTDHLRTVARQCYAWSLPYGVSFQEKVDVSYADGIISDSLSQKLEMLANDIAVFGASLSKNRSELLNNESPSFLARYRSKK